MTGGQEADFSFRLLGMVGGQKSYKQAYEGKKME